jgi:hypothetical protein
VWGMAVATPEELVPCSIDGRRHLHQEYVASERQQHPEGGVEALVQCQGGSWQVREEHDFD